MARRYAENLAKLHNKTTREGYFEVIIDSLANGQRKQVRNQFNAMKKEDQEYFLINYLKNDGGYHQSVKNICIEELCA